jgi:hypothetical protein
MERNKKEQSIYSLNEVIIKKEKPKEGSMLPPRSSIKYSRDSYIKELRKNLIGNPQNIQQNLQLQEELNKIKAMMNNNNSLMNIPNNNNINISSSAIHVINNLTNNNESEIADFDNAINNNSHNSHNELNLEEDQLNSSTDLLKDKEKLEKDLLIKFDKYPSPRNKAEIKIFFTNLICYINSLLSTSSIKNNTKLYDELLIFKYKLETRYNDYKNRGLDEKYFINILNQNQEELINKIGIGKKEDNINSINLNSVINIHSNYHFMGKKRKKSLSEMKSITDGSSSYEDKDENLSL